MSDQPSWLVAEPYTDVDLRQEAVAGPLDRDRARGDVEAASQLADAFEQLLVGLRAITATGFAHGDLSAYNLLWWEERPWFIDFPQSIDIAANLQGLDFFHRDVLDVVDWFERRGLDVDAEEVFADLLSC